MNDLSSTDSPFRLLPWEHAGVSPAPSRVIEARVEGALVRFEAKWREGRAYFRLADEDDHRVWASWDCVGENQLARAIETGNIGRYFAVRRGFSSQTVGAAFGAEIKSRVSFDLFGSTTLAVIVTDDNCGRAQEWCGGPWLEFAIAPRPPIRGGARKPSIWHRGWNAAGLRGALANLAGELAFRPFAPDMAANQPLTFACGSAAMLQQLYQAAHVALARDFVEKSPRFANYAPRRVHQTIEAQSAQSAPSLDNYYVYAPPALLAAFVQYNLPLGGRWRHPISEVLADSRSKLSQFLRQKMASAAKTPRRIHYHFEPHTVTIDFAFPLHPSAHEQLEARLLLRDWMRETLPSAQFARLRKWIDA